MIPKDKRNEVVITEDGEFFYVEANIGSLPRIGKPLKDKNGADVFSVPPGVEIQSYDHAEGVPTYSPITNLTVEENCPCVSVKTERHEGVVSDNESLCVFSADSGDVHKRSPADSVGEYVPCLKRDIQAFGTWGDFDIGWWLGAYLSDGWLSKDTVGYAKTETVKRDRFERTARRLHHNFVCREYPGKKGENKLGNSVKLHMVGADLASIVRSLNLSIPNPEGCRQAITKTLPKTLLNECSEECLYGMFCGFMDGDGSISRNTSAKNGKPRYNARLSTSAPGLRDGFIKLCFKLGLRYSLTTTPPRNHSREAYSISVSAPDLYACRDRLACTGEKEAHTLKLFREEYVPNLKKDKDTVPLSSSERDAVKQTAYLIQDTAAYTAMSKPKTPSGVYGMSRAGLRDVLEAMTDDGDEERRSLIDSLSGRCAASDVLWEKVVSVEPCGDRQVFDVVVQGTMVFSINDGFVIYDTASFTVPVSKKAVDQARELMMPEKNLLSSRFGKPAYVPTNEYLQGLYFATKAPTKKPAKIFKTMQEAMAAYRRGDIRIDDPIKVVEN